MTGRSTYRTKSMFILLLVTEILFWLTFVGIYLAILKYVPAIRFDNPRAFWLLAAIPAISVLYMWVLYRKNARIARFADANLAGHMVSGISSTRTVLKFLLFKFGVAFLILALVNPKIGTRLKEVTTQGIDIIFCLDVSRSMLAEDVEPNRLERAKRSINQIIDRLGGDRIGVVIFAGNAYTQLPITTDYEAAKMFISGVDTDMLSVQGTAIGAAVELAMESFDPESTSQKSIIIITDGENHEDDALSAVERAASQGMEVHVVGMGSVEGAPIPEFNNRGKQIGFKEDQEGKTVVSALNEPMLTSLVDAGNGIFVRATGNYVAIDELVNALNEKEKAELETVQFADYEHRFQWFLGIGLLLLLADSLILPSSQRWSHEIHIID
ncbi:MAG: VWA domain-containing protein [Flavobacteriales bacterium]|nr:VWA domain-containing protein [Flavobacteriales bacterium]